MTPADQAFRLINGYRASQIVHAAVELDIPDLVASGRASIDELSADTGIQASRLRRLLRALVALGVLADGDGGRFALTEVGAMLRDGVPGSRRPQARMLIPESYLVWDHFMETLRTGATAHSLAYGQTLWERIAADPDFAVRFNEAMAANSKAAGDLVARTADLSGASVVVDVGGGTGALLAVVVAANPGLRGIVFDLAAGLTKTAAYMAERGLTDRVTTVVGDFFESLPTADVYLLKDILHDWDDAHAERILSVCRKAMPGHGRVLIVERVMPSRMTDTAADFASAMTDLHMMVMLGGQERTLEELGALFSRTGLEFERFSPGEVFHLVEAKAV